MPGGSLQNTFNGPSESPQPEVEVMGAPHQAKGRLGKQVHFAVLGTSENDSAEINRHEGFMMQMLCACMLQRFCKTLNELYQIV